MCPQHIREQNGCCKNANSIQRRKHYSGNLKTLLREKNFFKLHRLEIKLNLPEKKKKGKLRNVRKKVSGLRVNVQIKEKEK